MHHGDCLLLLSSAGKVLWVSKSTTNAFGYSEAELLGMGLPSCEFLGPVTADLQCAIEGVETEREGNACLRDKLNRGVAVNWKVSRLPAASREFGMLLVISAPLEIDSGGSPAASSPGAIEDTVSGILRWAPDGRLMEANPALAKMFGYSCPPGMIRKVRDLTADICSSRDQYADFMRRMEEAGFVEGFELEVLKADRTVFWVAIHARPVRDAESKILYFEGSMFDITKQKCAEQESQRTRNHLRALTARLHDVREEERTSIARELHDELGRDLTLLTLDLAWLRERLLKMAPDDVQKPLAEKIATMEQTIQMTLKTVRRILSALRPPLLDELGLKDAIEFQVQEFSKRLGIRYEFNATAVTVPSEKTRIAVFRIFQEILTNVARHAKASRIKVDLVEFNSVLLLIVDDNGCGIAEDKVAQSKGFGILGIRERAWGIGGEIEIRRMSSSGTRVMLRVPLTADPTDDESGAGALNDPPAIAKAIPSGAGVPQTEFPFNDRILGARSSDSAGGTPPPKVR